MVRRYTLEPTSDSPRTSNIAYEEALNAEQLAVVTAQAGPTLVLAGPGSGKTRTLTYRVAYLLEQGIAPEQILLVTFTVKAAREMLDRLERIVGYKPENLWGGTFHHIGNILLRRHAEHLNRTPNFGILDEEDAKSLVSQCIQELKVSCTATRLPQANILLNLFSLSVNTYRPLEELLEERAPQFSELFSFIQKVETRYKEKKQASNLMDYDDLLFFCLKLFKEHPEIQELYSQRFQHILVDEYQDTNKLQFELIQALSGAHKNVLAVGDDAQSIYAFRGANLRNLLDFPEIFDNAEVYRLETNYRSTPEILELANTSINNNTQQFPKDLKSVQESGILPAVVPLSNTKQQSSFVAQRILELRDEGTSLQDIAVLFRARFQAAELELELAKRNIPYIIRGGVRFFEQAHIKDVLAHLRIFANGHDQISWDRLLRLQDGIGSSYAQRIREYLEQQANPIEVVLSGAAGVQLPKKAGVGWGKLIKTLENIYPNAQDPAKMIAQVLEGDYPAYLETHFKDYRDRREDIEQLSTLASNYTELEQFLEDITLRESFSGESIQGWEEPDEHLVLSTIHQAKGLEWSSVFVIGLAEGQFPHPKAFDDLSALEEERRLFYVAVTRTKKELYLTYPLTRYTYDRGEVIMRPSQFLQELPENLFELWRVGEATPTFGIHQSEPSFDGPIDRLDLPDF